jgi:Caspase domain
MALRQRLTVRMTARLFSFVPLFIATLALVAGAAPGSAAERVALVIGNGAYQALPVLPNPANDATDVAAALGEMGYDVTVQTNATRPEMANVIARFAERRGVPNSLFSSMPDTASS